jgi:Uma2 family endonuclease
MSVAIQPDKKYTYADYLKWSDDRRWEIIEGTPYSMTPAPERIHQKISGILFNAIFNFLAGKGCEVYAAPFDVRLTEKGTSDRMIDTVVQPDISVICDKNKLDDRGCIGAPDCIIEILSPSTSYKDETTKLKIYEKSGVREYWIVNTELATIMLYSLSGTQYGKPAFFHREDVIRSRVLKGFSLKLQEVFHLD